jgi:hypothetical protein
MLTPKELILAISTATPTWQCDAAKTSDKVFGDLQPLTEPKT